MTDLQEPERQAAGAVRPAGRRPACYTEGRAAAGAWASGRRQP